METKSITATKVALAFLIASFMQYAQYKKKERVIFELTGKMPTFQQVIAFC